MEKILSASNSNDERIEKFDAENNGVFSKHPEFLKELKEVKKFYEFYEGFNNFQENINWGQYWETPEGLDYEPTKEIRNLTQKLINKQSRFMLGKAPTITMHPFDADNKTLKESAETKASYFNMILDRTNFWSNCGKAFTDACIGKRVLMVCQALPGKDISIQFYTMPEFMYEVDPNNPEILKQVQIVYQDERTKGKKSVGEQIWHWYTYRMQTAKEASGEREDFNMDVNNQPERTCWCEYKMTDGEEKQLFYNSKDNNYATVVNMDGEQEEILLEAKKAWDTGLSQLPCYVIINEGLTGDRRGTSDLKQIMCIQNNLNKTISDFRDALRFKMFEQPVVIDASSKSIEALKIAPNALIDLKTDSALSVTGSNSKQAKVGTMASSFTFKDAAAYYLDGAKKEMYETFDQPLPDKIQEAPSGKAMQMLFYDLQSRCNRKWQDWSPAIRWLVRFLEECFEKVSQLEPEAEEKFKNAFKLKTSTKVEPNYTIPSDEDEKRQTSIAEVLANVKSHKEHISEFGNVEDEDAEWNLIVQELGQIDEQSGSTFTPEPEGEPAAEPEGEPDE